MGSGGHLSGALPSWGYPEMLLPQLQPIKTHPLLGPPPPRATTNLRSISPPPVSIPTHLPQSHPHPGPIITWGPYPLPQSYLHPDPILTWDPFPPWSHPYLGPLATLVPSLLETQPYLRPTPQESRLHAGTPALPGFQCTGLKMPRAHPVPRRALEALSWLTAPAGSQPPQLVSG